MVKRGKVIVKIRINVNRSLFFLLYTLPMINLILSAVIPIMKLPYFRFIFLMCVLQIHYFFLIINPRKKIKVFLYDTIIIISALRIIINGNGILYLLHTDVFNFWMLLAVLLIYSDKNIMEKFLKYVSQKQSIAILTTWITLVVLLISLVTGSGFLASQRTIVFVGCFTLEHELAYHCIIVYSILSIVDESKWKRQVPYLKVLIVIFCLLTAVRSAAIALFILLFFDFRKYNINKKILLASVAGIVIIFIVLNPRIIQNIPLITKTVAAENVGDISNGRTMLNNRGKQYFLNNMSLHEQLFGITMSDLRNKIYFGLHAHNDFYNILIGYGIVFVLITMVLLILFCKGKNGIFLCLIMISLAVFNGLYMYSEMVISLPILKYCIMKYQFKRRVRKKNGISEYCNTSI